MTRTLFSRLVVVDVAAARARRARFIRTRSADRELERLVRLRETGVLSESEFAEKRDALRPKLLDER
ncbi:MAG: hypothetical protein MZW92_36290 [Comamonadaceae bacterium]|nr:hypothetical protein [Comamonadaceae bacterium]